ncbi:MAG: AbrB family transcriptional regulator [Planctomycetota bacterium]|jgi:membrane AbrB-like protein|nr:AbrB family transcriptional regulator [Planctomycetota bacterium]
MESFLGICLTFAVGSAGFFVFARCGAPNPALLGSMFATGILNLTGHYPAFPAWFISLAANLLIGMMVGRQIDRNILQRIRALARPVFVQTAGILALSVACGYTLHLMGGGKIDLLTAFISASAGGITEMAVFGLAMNADVPVVVLVQVFRVVVALSLIPYIAVVCDKFGQRAGSGRAKQERPKLPLFARFEYVPLTLFAVAGSALGAWLNIPSGGFLGAVVASGAFAVSINKVYKFNAGLRSAAQIALGLIMGQRMTPEIAIQLWHMLLPAVTVTVVMLIGCVLLALLLHKTTGWDLTTCLLCTAPAGLSQITVYAEEIGVDSFVATVFHTVRIISIVALYPLMILPMVGMLE